VSLSAARWLRTGAGGELPGPGFDDLAGAREAPVLRQGWAHYTSLKAELSTIATSLARTIDARC